MATIEERAIEIFENYPNPYEMPYDTCAYFDGEQVVDMMVKIATDQKQIDIEKACNAFCKSQCGKVTNSCQECGKYKVFRKAMEE